MIRKLLTIGHSYVVDVNRKLPHALQEVGGGDWEVTLVAPDHFIGRNDIRPLTCEVGPDEPVEVIKLPARSTSRVHFFTYGGGGLRKLIRARGFDLVHAWEEPYILAGSQIARAARGEAPLVFRTAQSLPKTYPPPFSWIENSCTSQMAGWIYSGRLVEQNLLSRRHYPDKPRHCAPLGFDADAFQPDAEAGLSVRKEIGWEAGSLVVGYLGRLVEEKGLRVLMAALDACQADWRLLLVGNGPLASEVRRWGERWPGRVHLADDVQHSEVPRYLNAMDVLAAPSLTAPHWREQFGRMLVEAFACGVPVIGSDSGEIPYVIRETGLVVPEGNAAALAAAIDQLLADEFRRSKLSAEGIERAGREYTWSAIARGMLGFFDQILNEAP